ncbi:MAG: sulfatase-like hydrolase/transferase [Isosphaeraceae bacterium]
MAVRPNWVEGIPGAGRKELAAYAAAVTAVDDQVGRIVEALDELQRADDTIVFVTSDHGDMLGSQGARLKRKPWEESIRVPGILRYPRKVKPGRVEEFPITHVDLAPTFLGLAGLSVPGAMQGVDLSRAILGGDRSKLPTAAFFQILVPFAGDGTPQPWRGVRTDRFMYARTSQGPWVLYDLKQDPYERNNLAHDPAQRETLATLERELSAWMTRIGDDWSLNSMEPVEDKGRLYRFGTFSTIEEYLDWARKNPTLAPRD